METPALSFKERFMQVINEPDTKPWLFEVGQNVRVKKRVLEDGQTPAFWVGVTVKIVGRHNTMISKDHWYKLQHENGATDEFREEELDFRYSHRVCKNSNPKSTPTTPAT